MQVSGECVETLADGCVYLLIYIDVTDVTGLKEIQKKLEAALDAAEKANRAKTIFLSHMSHDIRKMCIRDRLCVSRPVHGQNFLRQYIFSLFAILFHRIST